MPPLTPIQSQAVARLLAGLSVAAVARELQIDRSTIYDWRNSKPQFRQALDEGRARLNELTADALADLAATAVETLRQLLTSVITPPSVRLRAAESVLRAVQAQQTARPAAEAAAAPPPAQPDAVSTPPAASISRPAKVGRNELCPCGSLKKFKRCCGNPLVPSGGGGFARAGGIPQNPTLSGGGPGRPDADPGAPPPPLDLAA